MAKHGFRGYISSREVNGAVIPQRIQNLVIRQYAQTLGIPFLLSATEYYMNNCYMMLKAVLKEELDQIEGMIFYSLHMMPTDRALRLEVYKKVLDANAKIHFALENLVIQTQDDVAMIEDILSCRSIIVDADKRQVLMS